MPPAQRDTVVGVGRSAPGVLHHVMDLAPGRGNVASGDQALAVTDDDRTSLMNREDAVLHIDLHHQGRRGTRQPRHLLVTGRDPQRGDQCIVPFLRSRAGVDHRLHAAERVTRRAEGIHPLGIRERGECIGGQHAIEVGDDLIHSIREGVHTLDSTPGHRHSSLETALFSGYFEEYRNAVERSRWRPLIRRAARSPRPRRARPRCATPDETPAARRLRTGSPARR